jgi:hypothetical protein
MRESAVALTGFPLLRRAVAALSPRKPLAGCTAKISILAEDDLPELSEVLQALACSKVDVATSQAPSRILLHTSSGTRELRLELRRNGDDPALSTADFPVVAYLLERWYLDFRVWDALLPRAARGSLPGRVLTINGYRRRGRLIAWRARQLGLRVQIEESDPCRMLDAVFDGFKPCAATPDAPDLMLDTLADDADIFGVPATVPRGLADELTALSAFVLAALGTFEPDGRGPEDYRQLIEPCNRRLVDLILELKAGS